MIVKLCNSQNKNLHSGIAIVSVGFSLHMYGAELAWTNLKDYCSGSVEH